MKHMKLLLAASLLLGSTAAQAAEPLIFKASAKVEIDATGAVTSVEPLGSLSPALQDMVRSQVRAYRFEALLRNGTKVPGTTYVNLGGCAVPNGDGYKVSLDYKSAGPRFIGTGFLPPKYPANAYRSGYEADAVVTYLVEPDGTAAVEGIRYKGKSRGNTYFDEAIKDWVAKFRYEPEMIAGHGISTKLEVPVTFEMGDISLREFKAKEIARRKGSAECMAAASTGELEPVAVDSSFKRVPAG